MYFQLTVNVPVLTRKGFNVVHVVHFETLQVFSEKTKQAMLHVRTSE